MADMGYIARDLGDIYLFYFSFGVDAVLMCYLGHLTCWLLSRLDAFAFFCLATDCALNVQKTKSHKSIEKKRGQPHGSASCFHATGKQPRLVFGTLLSRFLGPEVETSWHLDTGSAVYTE